MKYYRNVITVEWLSNDPWGDEAGNLEIVAREIDQGGAIGYVTRTVANAELTRAQAVQRDISYGGDGSFITLGEDDWLPQLSDGEPGYPRTCVLPGEGEDPDDCTTHDHEPADPADPEWETGP